MEDKKGQIVEEVKEAAPEGRISCTAARSIAEKLDVPVCDVGNAADDLGIKIYGCELGCF